MSNKAGPVIAGVAIIGGLYLLTRKAKAVACIEVGPDRYYYFNYTGPDKTFKAALGECYPVINTIDVWDEHNQYWTSPADPDNDILESGAKCRVQVQAPCTLCGFIQTPY